MLSGCKSTSENTSKSAEYNEQASKNSLPTSDEKRLSKQNSTVQVSKPSSNLHDLDDSEIVENSNKSKKVSPILLFHQSAYRKIWRHFYYDDNLNGESVKIQVKLFDSGHIESLTVLSSSGSKELERSAISAIRKAEPFFMPKRSDPDFPLAKTMKILFEPQ